MLKTLNWGILGCARICRRAMFAGIRNSGVGEITAIASRDGQMAAAWAKEFSIARHYDSYDKLLADPNVDAIYIPLPNDLHLPWVTRAALAGKHVLCEKPLALDAAQAEQMVAVCRRQGVMLMEAFMWRHHARVARARQMIADGKLGELRLIKMDFSFIIDPNDWRLNSQQGGGALFDLGCYGINAARLFTGQEPLEVLARTRRHTSGVDMTTGFVLRMPGDVLGVMDCSFECPNRNRMELVGTRGSLELPEGVLPPSPSTLIYRDETGAPQKIQIGACDQYAEQVRAFTEGVANGKLPDPAEDGLANMRVLQQAVEATRHARLFMP